jgi:hypothetical protein
MRVPRRTLSDERRKLPDTGEGRTGVREAPLLPHENRDHDFKAYNVVTEKTQASIDR